MRQLFGASRRQTELKRAIGLPDGSRTGPVECASSPSAATTTRSGSHVERRFLFDEEALPCRANLGLAVQHLAAEEHGLLGQMLRERRVIALGHAARERAFGVDDLPLQRGAIDLREGGAPHEQRTGDEP